MSINNRGQNILPPLPTLKDYVFGDILGRGTYGVVYKTCKKGSMGRHLAAIKCIWKKGLKPCTCDNLVAEISILKKIKNGDLSSFLKKRRENGAKWIMPENLVKHFLQQLAAALQVLRSHEVSHFDLKPHNILLSRKNTFGNVTLKLADFGFAKHLTLDDEESGLRGSPMYMAPEILLKHKFDARADLWSVGVILYEIIFGVAPFHSESFSSLAEKIKSNKPIRIPSSVRISSLCSNLLVGLLQRDPSKRISFQDFFSHPFLDLEHIPSIQSYNTGCQILKDAVESDRNGHLKQAADQYLDGLQYLVPIVQWGIPLDPDSAKLELKKNALRQKVSGYLERLEILKKSVSQNSMSSKEEADFYEAYEECLAADYLADAGLLSEALEKYKRSLEPLVKLVKKSSEKEEVAKQISQWITRAQEIKTNLQKEKENPESPSKSDKKRSGAKWITLKEKKGARHKPRIIPITYIDEDQQHQLASDSVGCRVQ